MIPLWLQIVIAVFGLIGTVFGICGLTAYINERMKHKASRLNQLEDARAEEIEQMRQEHYLNSLRSIIREENASIKADISEIKSNLALNTKGTVTILRNDMKKSLDVCKEKGFASSSDIANWKELYKVYGELGGNHFAEFVDAWKKELESLPPQKKSKKKLVEDK